MTADELVTMSGADLDHAGAGMKLSRITVAGGHAFDEADDSYRRRLRAELIGAAEAGAMSQPPMIMAPETAGNGPINVTEKLRDDGPTVEEFVLAGYPADKYPPHGYASKSSAEEIEAAIMAQKAAKSHVHTDDEPAKPAADKNLP